LSQPLADDLVERLRAASTGESGLAGSNHGSNASISEHRAMLAEKGIPYLVARVEDARSREAQAATEAALCELLIEALKALVRPDEGEEVGVGSDETNTSLRGAAAVLAVMGSSDRVWTSRDVHAELQRRGWVAPGLTHPVEATEAAMNRLWKANKIERIGRGRYRILG